MKVDELPVDGRIKRLIRERGIEELYPPQVEALRSGVLEGKNLVLAIPTASGKTLVSEIVMVNKLLQEGGKAVYLVPLKALAEEKYREFKEWEKLGLRVAATMGDYDSTDEWLGRYDIIVATAEKFDSLLRHGASWIRDVKVVVADEVHLIGSYDRGATLEMILTHLLGRAQILALSATVGNAEELAEWLDATLVVSDWRPVELRKGVFDHGTLLWEDGSVEHYPENWMSLAVDAVKRGKGALVFVSTRRSAEKEAISLSSKIARYLTKPERRALEDLIGSIEDNPTTERLKRALRGGVAFHHAGLSRTERTLIEDAFRRGLIKVITATPTLCMHPETPVITKNGIKKVSELTEGDEVLTHSGRFKRVISPLKRPHRGRMLVIKAGGTPPVRVTPEHMVWVLKRIRHESHYPNGRQVIWWEFKGPEWMTAQELKELVENNDDEKVSYMLLQPIPKTHVNVDKISLRKEAHAANRSEKTRKPHPPVKGTPEALPLNFETARLIGLWIAKGSSAKTGIIKFDIDPHEEELTEFLVKTIRKYFPRTNVVVKDRKRNRGTVRFCNRRFAEWLRENVGHRTHEKRLPEIIALNESREVRLGLIRGLIDGGERADHISYTTVSPSLAYQLQLLLASLGYVSSVSRKVMDPGKSKRLIYEVKVSGRSCYELLRELGLEVPERGNRTYNVNTIWNGYLLFKVRSVEEEFYEGDVYNLEVEDDESYSVGFVVHNSAGINLPAFRVIIRDTKRYSNFGWVEIPVLEIQQMMGRAGRPKYDKVGEAIIIARTEDPKKLMERYIHGKPEKLFSMLANEQAFRGQILALITNFGIQTFGELMEFLKRTFYAHQRRDLSFLECKAKNVVYFLIENEFIDLDLNERFIALPFGKRTSQLYIDPLTAKKFRDAFPSLERNPNPFGIFQLIASTPDMATLTAKRREIEEYLDLAYELGDELYSSIPYYEDSRFQAFLGQIKTAKVLLDWINEVPEARIYENYGIEPGDLHRILELADWLMYSLIELYKLFEPKEEVLNYLRNLHLRLRHGVREELLELVRLPNIGRKRARALYNAGFRTVDDIVKARPAELLKVDGIGLRILEGIYRHLGIQYELGEGEKRGRKGTLEDFFK